VLAKDSRFPSSKTLDGSDLMNAVPEYSAAYAILKADFNDRFEGHSLRFAIGRGNDLYTAMLARLVIDKALENFTANTNTFLTLM